MSISELGLQQILLQGFQRAQEGGETRQIQLSSGNKFQTYGEYGADALRLISSEGVFARATAFETAGKVVLTRLEMQSASITTIEEAVGGLRSGFIRTLATGASELLIPELETAAGRIISALNIQFGGAYLFGGADGTVPPVGAQALSDIGAAASIDGLFTEGDRIRLGVEEGVTVDGGPLASDLARDLFAELQELANAEATFGPFQGAPTDAQRVFLLEKSERLAAISADLNQQLGLSAAAQGQAADAVQRNVQRRDLAEIVAAEIEDADIAEVVARLNQDQLAVQASAQALAQATQLSLLNFI